MNQYFDNNNLNNKLFASEESDDNKPEKKVIHRKCIKK